jgi:putative ABC transport system permease protein
VCSPRPDTPDDRAVFVDVKTTWIIAGISHGHHDVTRAADPDVVLLEREDEVVTNAAIVEYNEVTPENVHTFHTHAAPDELPLSAIIVVPHSTKDATLLRAPYNLPDSPVRMLDPPAVIADLMSRVFEIQRLFNAAFALVGTATALFLVLVLLLSQRLRQRELVTLARLGCSRRTAAGLLAAELALVLLLSVAVAGGLTLLALWTAPEVIPLL